MGVRISPLEPGPLGRTGMHSPAKRFLVGPTPTVASHANVAQLVERDVANVEVAGS